MNLDSINEYIEAESINLIAEETKREITLNNINVLEKDINSYKEYIELYEKTVILLQHAISYAREQAKSIIENIVTSCLRYVFKTNIRFIIKEETTKKGAGMEFYVTDENGNPDILTIPEESRGGGIVDVVSLGLRLSIAEILTANNILGPIILDEPAKYVSKDYISNVGLYLKNFSIEFNRQIIMVTHDSYLSYIGDKNFSVTQNNGISTVVDESNRSSNEAIFEDEIIEFEENY